MNGQLIRVRSPLDACRGESTSAACRSVLDAMRNPFYIGDHPGLTQTSGWVDAWTSRPSVYAVAARSSDHVVAAVNFAREHDLRLVVRGGGHSYQGTSDAPDSLLVWTRRMHDVALHDAFVPEDCRGAVDAQHAVTVEAGAMWIDVYDAVTTKAGRYVQGGGCASVGVAGLVQSGGFGSFSKRFGTAAGGLLEAEIVTADGVARIANACRNPELFWAIKGGGGGSLGVVTRLTLRTHELPEYFGGAAVSIKATSPASFRRLLASFLEFYRDSLLNPHWGEVVKIEPDDTLVVSMVSQGLDSSAAASVWKPFLDRVTASPDEYRLVEEPSFRSAAARRWWDVQYRREHAPGSMIADPRPGAPPTHSWWRGDGDQVGVFLHGFASAWLPASLLAAPNVQRLADSLFAASRHWEVQLHFNKGLAGAPGDALDRARDTAMNPAVLDAFALAIIAAGGPPAFPGIVGHEPDLPTARENAAKVRSAIREIRRLLPRPGSYVSESNYFEADWQHSFWGSNYDRLLAAKRRYDPSELFFVHHGVGSEGWSEDGFTRS
ncbi:MAG TPA: FAD-dependent oxidoreductase [Gemmatimonadaceae bacterium]